MIEERFSTKIIRLSRKGILNKSKINKVASIALFGDFSGEIKLLGGDIAYFHSKDIPGFCYLEYMKWKNEDGIKNWIIMFSILKREIEEKVGQTFMEFIPHNANSQLFIKVFIYKAHFNPDYMLSLTLTCGEI